MKKITFLGRTAVAVSVILSITPVFGGLQLPKAHATVSLPDLTHQYADVLVESDSVQFAEFGGEFSSSAMAPDGKPVIVNIKNKDGNPLTRAIQVLKCLDIHCAAHTTSGIALTDTYVGASIAVGPDNKPIVSGFRKYHSVPLGSDRFELFTIKCTTPDCTGSNIRTVIEPSFPPFSSISDKPAIAIGSDGNPIIAYHGQNTYLYVFKCASASCRSGGIPTLLDARIVANPSIAIGSDGLAVISYFDVLPYDLRVAKCGNIDCTSGNVTTTVDSNGDVGAFNSIAISPDGFPVIAYRDGFPNEDLKVVKCAYLTCTNTPAGNFVTVDTGGTSGIANVAGWYNSIKIGNHGFPWISYEVFGVSPSLAATHELYIVKCGDDTCTPSAQIFKKKLAEAIDFGVQTHVGDYGSLLIASDGIPVVSYNQTSYTLSPSNSYDYHYYLMIAHCVDAICTYGQNQKLRILAGVRNDGNVAAASSVTRFNLTPVGGVQDVATFPLLPTGSAVSGFIAQALYTGITSGIYSVTSTADVTQLVPESNENNNVISLLNFQVP